MKIQLISINILNSNYKFLFNLVISLLIYFCFYLDSNIVFCMNETSEIDYWKALFYASQQKVRHLESEIPRLIEENLDLSLENISLRERMHLQHTFMASDIQRTLNLEQEALKLKEELEIEKQANKLVFAQLIETKRELAKFQSYIETDSKTDES